MNIDEDMKMKLICYHDELLRVYPQSEAAMEAANALAPELADDVAFDSWVLDFKTQGQKYSSYLRDRNQTTSPTPAQRWLGSKLFPQFSYFPYQYGNQKDLYCPLEKKPMTRNELCHRKTHSTDLKQLALNQL
ncbi:hypothetical protein CEXT_284781 [Caerostris extrusa]|uniref:Uncharacterized protein n=1 Tax=Caerostris extrusa TaxID=172846 RepID=A0AAV4Q8M7_CAEEX|nr:hypothetical protein CEXT_284781 [Caerostris extrusa]